MELAVEEHADAPGVAGLPVVLAHLAAVEAEPGEVLDAADPPPLEPAPAAEDRVMAAQLGDPPAPGLEVVVDVVPVEPRQLGVLAVGVVVAGLGAADLVAAEDHRHALREQQGGEDVAALLGAQGEHLLVVGLALDAAVPRAVVRLAVAVVLAVGLVVLVVVGDEVAQREPVVGGDEVDRRRRSAGVGLVEVGAAGEAVAELGERRRLATPEVADRVAVAAVPLRPQRREVADLVAALADVPRLGDQLDLRHDGVLLDEVEERRQLVDGEQLAGQRRGEVEAEPVDVHLGDPVAQAVHDQLQHVRVADVEAVAGAREVDVVAGLVVHHPVVGEVVDAAHRQHRAHVVALGGVVVDDVEDHLDVGAVQRLDHRLELLHLALRLGADDVGQLARGDAVTGHRVAVVRGEEGDRVVAPVVAQAALDEVVVVDELVHRHQLDRRDPERGEVVDDGRVGDGRVRAAHLLGHRRVALREALDVGLVDDRVVHPVVRRAVVAPVEERVGDDGARDVRRAVGRVHLVGVVEVVGEAGLVPVDLAVDRLGVRVEQELGRVAPQPLVRVPRSVDAVAVALAGADVGEVGVPAVAVDLGQLDPHLGAIAVRRRAGTARRRRRRWRTGRSWCPSRRRWRPAGTGRPTQRRGPGAGGAVRLRGAIGALCPGSARDAHR